MKKLYLVRREVYARNIKEALTNRGEVVDVVIAEEKYQPVKENKAGFRKTSSED